MNYEVFVTNKASGQLFEAAQWWTKHRSVEQAKRWFDGFVSAIDSLQDNPERCALARENDDLPVTIRELHYGLASKPTHRAIFVVRPDRVVVYSIRHIAQRDVTVDDLY